MKSKLGIFTIITLNIFMYIIIGFVLNFINLSESGMDFNDDSTVNILLDNFDNVLSEKSGDLALAGMSGNLTSDDLIADEKQTGILYRFEGLFKRNPITKLVNLLVKSQFPVSLYDAVVVSIDDRVFKMIGLLIITVWQVGTTFAWALLLFGGIKE